MLEDLTPPAPRIGAPAGWRPSVQFDETIGQGEAVTPGLFDEPNFDAFLEQAGYDPALYEVVGNTVRTSKWQQREGGDWLTSFRFTFRLKNSSHDLPLLYAAAKKSAVPKIKTELGEKSLIICWADLQVGKVDLLGGFEALIARVEQTRVSLVELIKKEKITEVVFIDVGDTVENFGNAANLNQLQQNDLSIMEQVDLATTLAWETLKSIAKYVPVIRYGSVGSNHCQWRVQKQVVGLPGRDDWAIFITKTIAKLAKEVGYKWKFFIPEPHEESLTIEVQGHQVAVAHGHQAPRPDGIVAWWRGQQFGNQPTAHADILITGHFHHLRVQECGAKPNGQSRFWVQSSTLDNGSGWFRRTSGESAVPGLTCFILEQGKDFTGTVYKL